MTKLAIDDIDHELFNFIKDKLIDNCMHFGEALADIQASEIVRKSHPDIRKTLPAIALAINLAIKSDAIMFVLTGGESQYYNMEKLIHEFMDRTNQLAKALAVAFHQDRMGPAQ